MRPARTPPPDVTQYTLDDQSKDIFKLEQRFTPAEALKMLTYDNAQLLA